MPILSSKRQVTLPKEVCDRLGVTPGDDLDIVDYGGRITLLKKRKGASAGVLGHVKGNAALSDEDSLLDAVKQKNSHTKTRKVA